MSRRTFDALLGVWCLGNTIIAWRQGVPAAAWLCCWLSGGFITAALDGKGGAS